MYMSAGRDQWKRDSPEIMVIFQPGWSFRSFRAALTPVTPFPKIAT